MHHHIWATVLGLIGLLGLAVAMVPVAGRLNFPYTVLLAVVGIALGALGYVDLSGLGPTLGPLGDFLAAAHGFSITSEAVLFIFLPALVFEAALAIDVRRLVDDIAPILVLAVFGLLVSTFMIGYVMWWAAPVPLVACLLLGAILSATDPVAVVAIFKDLGAPKRLAILVEGESLFNDATAIVMFTILAAMLAGSAEADVVGGAIAFVKVFVGGGIVGFALAWLLTWVLGYIRDLPLVESTLTICLAYLSFIVAEHYLHVSGVVAVVAAALVIGSRGRTSISPGSWHVMTETWEQIGFWANSLIFVLVGIAVPGILGGITGTDLGLLALAIVIGTVARAVVIYGMIPGIDRFTRRPNVSGAYKTIMWWGGLRGAVSLALALAVIEAPTYSPEVKHFVGVTVCGFVLFTLFAQATTIRWLLGTFGLDKLSPADLAIRNRAIATSLSQIERSIEAAATTRQVPSELSRELIAGYQRRMAEVEDELGGLQGIGDDDWEKIGLATLAGQERSTYLRFFTDAYVSPTITRRLLGTVEDLIDGVKMRGLDGYRAALDRHLGFGWRFRLAMWLQRRFGIAGPLTRALADRFEILLTMRIALNEELAHGLPRLSSLLNQQVCARLEELLRRRLARTEEAVAALTLQYPDYARDLQLTHLGRVALRLESQDYRRMLRDSVISNEVYKDLQAQLDARAEALEARPSLDLGLDPLKLVAKVPFIGALPAARQAEIARLLKPRLAIPGEHIVRKGEAGDAMYFVSTGAARVDLEPAPITLGSGDFFGELALLTEKPRNANVTALGFCDLLVLTVRDFRRLLDANPEMRATIEQVARQRLSESAAD
jgi:CPA1 family monovalent cation:H+ antiporter